MREWTTDDEVRDENVTIRRADPDVFGRSRGSVSCITQLASGE